MTDKNIVSRRSFIFCPGLRPDMFPKAVNSCTDIVCIELEDGIAPKDNIDILDEQIPNSVKKFYEGGHGFFLEDYQAWKDVISFLKD